MRSHLKISRKNTKRRDTNKTKKNKRVYKKRKPTKRKRKPTKRKRKPTKRNSIKSGGSVTPRQLDHSHSHALFICEGHFNAVFNENTACQFWHDIFNELITDREVNVNAYIDQGTQGVRETETCLCCDISNDGSKKDCAVFRNLQYCNEDSPCQDIMNTSTLCGRDCTFCTSV